MQEQEHFESRLQDEEFLSKIREALATRLDEIATDPLMEGGGFPLELGEMVRKGEKIKTIRRGDVNDTLCGVAGDFRLTHDELDELKELFLEFTD